MTGLRAPLKGGGFRGSGFEFLFGGGSGSCLQLCLALFRLYASADLGVFRFLVKTSCVDVISGFGFLV